MGDITNNNTKDNTMIYKVIKAAIDLLQREVANSNYSDNFKADANNAIDALKKVAKYF